LAAEVIQTSFADKIEKKPSIKPVIEPVSILLQPKIVAPLPRMTRRQMKEQSSASHNQESSS
jgi:hypothetical protein